MTTAPNMATLERSLQKCSLNHSSSAAAAGFSPPSSSSSSSSTSSKYALPVGDCSRLYPCLPSNSASSTLVDLNSHLSPPYDWQQCLDLKTGEIYYINWRNGVKAKEDPRLTTTTTTACYSYYSDDEDDDDNEEDDCYYSEGSSTGNSSPCKSGVTNQKAVGELADDDDDDDSVLVVAGCKGCLVYYMVLKKTKECPKCNAQLLHFDRPQNSDALH